MKRLVEFPLPSVQGDPRLTTLVDSLGGQMVGQPAREGLFGGISVDRSRSNPCPIRVFSVRPQGLEP